MATSAAECMIPSPLLLTQRPVSRVAALLVRQACQQCRHQELLPWRPQMWQLW